MKKIESAEDKLKKRRKQVVYQLEGARKDVSIVKRWLDAPKEDPYWEHWTEDQRGELMVIHRELTEIQLKIRALTLQFVGKEEKKEIIDVPTDSN
jgi:hypothetical protein